MDKSGSNMVKKYNKVGANQSKTKTALVSASALYDVLNAIVIDATIARYRTSERKMAKQHINSGVFQK